MTASPTSSTTPVGSSPKIAGNLASGWCGNQVGQLLITLAMFGTMPTALTRTSTSVGRGVGTSMVSIDMGWPISCSRAARIIAIDGLLGRVVRVEGSGGFAKRAATCGSCPRGRCPSRPMIRTPELYQAMVRVSSTICRSSRCCGGRGPGGVGDLDLLAWTPWPAPSPRVRRRRTARRWRSPATAASCSRLMPALRPWDWWCAISYSEPVVCPTVRMASSRSFGLSTEPSRSALA